MTFFLGCAVYIILCMEPLCTSSFILFFLQGIVLGSNYVYKYLKNSDLGGFICIHSCFGSTCIVFSLCLICFCLTLLFSIEGALVDMKLRLRLTHFPGVRNTLSCVICPGKLI